MFARECVCVDKCEQSDCTVTGYTCNVETNACDCYGVPCAGNQVCDDNSRTCILNCVPGNKCPTFNYTCNEKTDLWD